MTRLSFALTVAASTLLALPLAAQARSGSPSAQNHESVDRSILTVPESASEHRARSGSGRSAIPRGHLPPRGLCRIWYDGVAPGRQPAPTDCRTALRNRPANARVVYSDGTTYPAARTQRDCILRDRDGHVVRDRDGDARYDRDCLRDRERDRWDDDDDDDRWDDDDDDRGRGWYDRDDWCLDRNRDGRCDAGTGGYGNGGYDRDDFPRTMPQMAAAVMMQQGIRSPEMRRWLGDGAISARVDTRSGRAIPQRITWVDRAGQIVQVWVDDDRDGRADRVEVYRSGRRVYVVR